MDEYFNYQETDLMSSSPSQKKLKILPEASMPNSQAALNSHKPDAPCSIFNSLDNDQYIYKYSQSPAR